MDRGKYDVVPLRIDRSGRWGIDRSIFGSPGRDASAVEGRLLGPDPSRRSLLREDGRPAEPVDVVIPLVHGTFGEDGCLQGLLEMAELPYVGSGVLASAVGMDKIEQKRLLAAAGIPSVDYVEFRHHEWGATQSHLKRSVRSRLGFPVFVKPANLGSSVGISKVRRSADLERAVTEALRFDSRVIIERAVPDAREIECSLLGGDELRASVLGEIRPSGEFYDYRAKYLDGTSELVIPAPLPIGLAADIRSCAVRAGHILGIHGMARVDFLLDHRSGEFVLNEVNTVPGFTSISMYPKLWEASGIGFSELLDRLIDLALERSARKAHLVRDHRQTALTGRGV